MLLNLYAKPLSSLFFFFFLSYVCVKRKKKSAMDAFRQKQVLCRTTLAPAVAKDKGEHTLRAFHAPARGNERESDTFLDKRRHSSLVKRQGPSVTCFNPLQRIRKMTSETLTDADAERIVYPFQTYAITTPFEQLLAALIDRLCSTVETVSWNKPQPHVAWDSDLRFFGPWWLVLRTNAEGSSGKAQAAADQHPSGRQRSISWVHGMHGEPLASTSTATLLSKFNDGKEENRYASLLPRGAGVAEENQLIADLAKRLAGPTDHLDIFHLSGLHMTADRVHVLFFSGFAKLAAVAVQRATEAKAKGGSHDASTATTGKTAGVSFFDKEEETATLSTLSFSSCQLGSAGLVVLLTGVAFLAAGGLRGVCTLDLSYNDLQSISLYSFTQLLRFTYVKRLSLRGNNLASVDVIPFREFLLEGCDHQVEELDLSYTELTEVQVGILIETLPCLHRLRVLLLEEVTIAANKWPSLVRAVERTQLWHLRLLPSTAPSSSSPFPSGSVATSSVVTYVKSIDEVCARNARRTTEVAGAAAASAARTGFFGLSTASFFEAFFRFSQLRVGHGGEVGSALPGNYGAFTNNDPSLL